MANLFLIQLSDVWKDIVCVSPHNSSVAQKDVHENLHQMGRNYPPTTTFAAPGLGPAKLFNGLRDQSVSGQDSGSVDFGRRSRLKPGSLHVFRDLGAKTFFRLMGSRKSHQKRAVNPRHRVDKKRLVSNIRRPQRSF